MANTSFLDLAKFTATSAGTGSFVVSAAITGYQTPATAGAVTATSYRYRAESADLTQWELGSGTYTSSNVTLTRTPIINSVAGTSAINFTLAPQVGIGMILKEDFTATGQIPGTQTNDAAAAGNIGEYVSLIVFSTSPVASSGTGTITSLGSISIAAGDWDVNAFLGVLPSSALTQFVGMISSSPTAFPADLTYLTIVQTTFTSGLRCAVPIASRRYLTANSTTIYLIAQPSHGSSASIYGNMDARRAR